MSKLKFASRYTTLINGASAIAKHGEELVGWWQWNMKGENV